MIPSCKTGSPKVSSTQRAALADHSCSGSASDCTTPQGQGIASRVKSRGKATGAKRVGPIPQASQPMQPVAQPRALKVSMRAWVARDSSSTPPTSRELMVKVQTSL
ncbi:MAG: hypothetical protein COX57_05305 [Alphaproteobacteria bacterium CG_4_10_14_0_2_um_filter_63_37]|nr:MAG: hypothetical protein COX57_05305 [Alphaproteobacteria bacterium CG_4_10_14_0_2_um_filter_63_37]